MTDPIADLCTRIRNSIQRKYTEVKVPYSVLKEGVIKVLVDEGFLVDYNVNGDKQDKHFVITLKYNKNNETVIREINRVSTPGRRVYKKSKEVKSVLGGQGIFVVTTPKGVLSDKQCRELGVGGEIMCSVW